MLRRIRAPITGCARISSNSGRRQRRLLSQHFVGDADLADVVQQGAEPQRAERRVVELQRAAHLDRQRADAFGMTRGVRIARVERGRERADRAQVRGLRLGFGSRERSDQSR